MRKKLIIGIVAGVVAVGGIVTAIIRHKRKRDAFRELDLYDDEDDDFWTRIRTMKIVGLMRNAANTQKGF